MSTIATKLILMKFSRIYDFFPCLAGIVAWRLHDKVHSFYSEHADKVGLLLNNLAQYAIMLSGFLLAVLTMILAINTPLAKQLKASGHLVNLKKLFLYSIIVWFSISVLALIAILWLSISCMIVLDFIVFLFLYGLLLLAICFWQFSLVIKIT